MEFSAGMMADMISPHVTCLSHYSTKGAVSHPPYGKIEIHPVARLIAVDVGRLYDGDEEEAAKLFKAAKEDGIFYLDLQDQRFTGMVENVDDVFALSKELFNLCEEEKTHYDIDELSQLKLNGYKPVGRNFGGVSGNRDGFESYTALFITIDPMMKIPGKAHLDLSFTRPSILTNHLPSLTTFLTQTHQILSLILSSLTPSLNLSTNASLVDIHRSDASSPDILRLLHYLAQPPSETGAPHTPHTDIGSLTLLFSQSPGLQVLPPHSTEWAFVLPRPACAIVNIGDGLKMLTGGLFHSCLHRVGPPPGQAMEERYSFAYLQRAEDDVKMEALPGLANRTANGEEVYTSREWLEKKFGMLRRKTWKEGTEGQEILTGRAGVSHD